VRLPTVEPEEAPPEPEDEPAKHEPESAGPLWAHSALGVGRRSARLTGDSQESIIQTWQAMKRG
jgi:hypothetical protein